VSRDHGFHHDLFRLSGFDPDPLMVKSQSVHPLHLSLFSLEGLTYFAETLRSSGTCLQRNPKGQHQCFPWSNGNPEVMPSTVNSVVGSRFLFLAISHQNLWASPVSRFKEKSLVLSELDSVMTTLCIFYFP